MDNYTNLRSKRIGFIGFGDIAEKAARELQISSVDAMNEPSTSLFAFKRNPENISELVQLHVVEKAFAIDVTKPNSLAILAELKIDYWVITLTPPALSEDDYRATYVQGLKNILAVIQPTNFDKLFWVSSTSVYGQANDEWVDERSITDPQRFSGRVQLDAEHLLENEARACVVRFSGIYREDRHRMIDRLKKGELSAECEEDYFTNRIHVIDAARSIVHLMNRVAGSETVDRLYLASDSSPVKYVTLIQWLSNTYNLPLNAALPAAKKRINSKRCSNQRLKDTGFEFRYNTYQTGFLSYKHKDN